MKVHYRCLLKGPLTLQSLISGSPNNPGRAFFKCCSHFLWDDEHRLRAKMAGAKIWPTIVR